MNELDRIAQQVFDTIETEWSKDIYDALTMGARYVYGAAVEGDIAEFGTMTGKTAVALSSAIAFLNRKHGTDTRLSEGVRLKKAWFFDSFEGLPEPRFELDKTSHHVAAGLWDKGSCQGLTFEQFNNLIGQILPLDTFTVAKGFFRDTVQTIDTGTRFSLIHIDGDLYESAIDVLDHLFRAHLVSQGAIIFFDDWNCNQANPELGERRAWREVVETYRVSFSDEGSYGFNGHKFIVHSYDS